MSVVCIFISPETGSQQTNKREQNKYTANRSNTTPAATLRRHNGIRHDLDKYSVSCI